MKSPKDKNENAASLAASIEVSRTTWVPRPLSNDDGFYLEVRRRIRHRTARNAALVSVALCVLLTLVLRKTSRSSSAPLVPVADLFEPPSTSSRFGQVLQNAVTAEGGLPDLHSEPGLEPWFHHALRDDFSVEELPREYGALGGLYLGSER